MNGKKKINWGNVMKQIFFGIYFFMCVFANSYAIHQDPLWSDFAKLSENYVLFSDEEHELLTAMTNLLKKVRCSLILS